MQIFKKALSLILALALVLSCIPALSGSVSAIADSKTALAQQQAISGITTENLQTLLADEVGKVTLHGVSYMEYTDVDNGSNGTVWMYGRIDNDTAKKIKGNEDLSGHGGNVYWHAREAAGGRIRLATDSSYIAISATLFDRNMYSYDSMGAGKYGFSVYADTADGSVYVGTITGTAPAKNSTKVDVPVSGMLDLSNAPKDPNGNYSLTIYFPLIIETREVSIGIADGSVYKTHGVPYSNDKPVVFYGSSITQGGASTDPSNAYTATVSRALNIDYISFGMWGSAAGQNEFAKYIAGLDMSAFVMDYDHNDERAAAFGQKHLAMYNTIRSLEYNNKTTPIIMVSRPNIHLSSNAVPESGLATMEDMKAEILKTYAYALSQEDKNVHFIDGEAFFEYDNGAIDTTIINTNASGKKTHPYTYDGVFLRDGIHPTDLGQASMADVVASVIRLVNAGYENIYFDLDEMCFGGSKEDLLFDSTDAVIPMTQNDWSAGTVSGKTLQLAAGQTAQLKAIENMDKLSGYTAVAALNIAQNASATVTIGGKVVTVSADGSVSCGGETGTFVPKANANGSVDVVVGITCIDNGFSIKANEAVIHVENGCMGGQLSYGAVNGAVTVNSLMVTAPTQRIEYYATLDSEITMNFKMHLVDDVAEGAYAKFECEGKESDKIDYVKKGDAYIFSYGVAAKNMADDISLNIYNSNGQMIAQHTTSVKNYADIIINGNYSKRFQEIAKALLNYGAAMQIYKGYNTSNLANNSFAENWDAEAIGADLSKYAPTASPKDTLPEGVQFHGTSLLLESKTVIRHYFIMNEETAANYSDTLEHLNETTFYYKDIEVDASNLDLMESFTLGNFTIRYSALSYAYLILNAEPNVYSESMVDLAKALYLYSISTEVIETEDNEFEVLPF